jgi:hypothetical protein
VVPVVRERRTVESDRRDRPSRRWIIACVLSVALIALLVGLLAPTFRRQGQYAALRERGVTTEARIEYCSSTVGSNLTFSGGITCPATFEVHGISVSEDLLGLPAQLRTGAEVRVMVDPQDVRDVYPLKDVRTDYKSGWVTNNTVVAFLAALLLVATITSQVIVVRRRRLARRLS